MTAAGAWEPVQHYDICALCGLEGCREVSRMPRSGGCGVAATGPVRMEAVQWLKWWEWGRLGMLRAVTALYSGE